MAKKDQPGEPVQPEGPPKNNDNGNGKKSATQDAIDKYKEELAKEIEASVSEEAAKTTEYVTKKSSHQYAVCCLTKSQEAWNEYRNINNNVATASKVEAELIVGDVEGFMKDAEELEATLVDACKAIKDTKVLLTEVKNMAQKLDDCITEEEICNPDLYNLLIGLETNQDAGELDFMASIEDIKVKAKDLSGYANTTFEAVIDVSGIQNFSSIDSLKSFGDSLLEKICAFKDNVDGNIKKGEDMTTTAQESLSAIIAEMSIARYSKYETTTHKVGLSNFNTFICEPNCPETPEDNAERLGAICAKVKDNFADLPGTDPVEEEQEKWEM